MKMKTDPALDRSHDMRGSKQSGSADLDGHILDFALRSSNEAGYCS